MKTRVVMTILLMVATAMLAGCDLVAKGEFYNLGGIVTHDDVIDNRGSYPAEGGAIITLENMHLKSAGAYAVYTRMQPDGSFVTYPPIYLAEGTAKSSGCYGCDVPPELMLAGIAGFTIPAVIEALYNRAELVIPMGDPWLVSCVVSAATNKGPFTVTLGGAQASYQVPADVPDLTGLTESEVTGLFTGSCLVLNIIRSSSETVPDGQVIDWDPKGVVPCGTTINVTISTGPASAGDVEVPNLAGLSEIQARDLLNPIGLSVGSVGLTYDNAVPKDKIISYTPMGKVPVGTAISIIVSMGPQLVPVPDLTGLTEEQVAAAFLDSCLAYEIEYARDNQVPKGQVINWNPRGTALCGTTIHVVVSSGPGDPEDVEVPDLTGMSETQVNEAFNGLCLVRLIIEATDANVPDGYVISWSPKGLAPCATTVNVVISSGPEGVAVPNVVGMAQAQATTTLTAAGLELGHVTHVPNALPEGQVVSSDPTAGSTVTLGTAVDIVVSLGPFTVGMSAKILSPASGSVFPLNDDVTVQVFVKGDPAKGPYTLVVSAAVMTDRVIAIPIDDLDFEGQTFPVPFHLDVFGDASFDVYLKNKDGVYVFTNTPYTVLAK